MIITFWGVFLVSFFVVTLQNMLTFNSNEEKSYTLLQRLEYKMQLKEQAAKVLVKSYKQRIIQQREPENKKKQMNQFMDVRQTMIVFQNCVRSVKNFYEADTDVEIMQRLIETLMDDIRKIRLG